jgi:TetR/AcrR family transcriptional regulator, ethionamide resistance regulator
MSKGDRRQEQILDAAESLLAELPWAQINIDDLAKASDMSRSTFYFYYESKDSLLAALLERVLKDTAQDAPGGWVSRPSDLRPLEAFRITFSHILDLWIAHGPVFAQAATLWSAVPRLQQQWDELQSSMISATAAQIDRERMLGKAPDGVDSMALSTALMWMCERVMSILTTESATALPEEDLVETLAIVSVRSIYLDDDPDP